MPAGGSHELGVQACITIFLLIILSFEMIFLQTSVNNSNNFLTNLSYPTIFLQNYLNNNNDLLTNLSYHSYLKCSYLKVPASTNDHLKVGKLATIQNIKLLLLQTRKLHRYQMKMQIRCWTTKLQGTVTIINSKY